MPDPDPDPDLMLGIWSASESPVSPRSGAAPRLGAGMACVANPEPVTAGDMIGVPEFTRVVFNPNVAETDWTTLAVDGLIDPHMWGSPEKSGGLVFDCCPTGSVLGAWSGAETLEENGA